MMKMELELVGRAIDAINKEMAALGRRRYDCRGCGWVSWIKATEPDHCHSRPSPEHPNCPRLDA